MDRCSVPRSMRMPILTTALIAALVALALALAACGGDDDDETTPTTPTTTAGATGATGAEGAPEGAAYDITAQEYLDASIPDQIKAMREFVEDNPDECEGQNAEGGGNFPQGVGIGAATVEPDTPMSEVILQECTE
jgi:hypothetical protein